MSVFFNSIIFLGLVILGIGLQSSWFLAQPSFGFNPNVVIAAIVWCALRRPFVLGGVMTLLVTYVAQANSSYPSGLWLLMGMLVYLGVRWVAVWFVMRTVWSYSILLITACMVCEILKNLFLMTFGVTVMHWFYPLRDVIQPACIQGVLSLGFIKLFHVVDTKTLGLEASEEDSFLWHF